MWQYIVARVCYAIPILLAVNILTFVLFFGVNSPDDMAELHLGSKYVQQAEIDTWKRVHGYHLPLLYNPTLQGISKITQTIFWQKSLRLFLFDFGLADNGSDIGQAIMQRAGPSLSLAVPALLCGVFLNITMAMVLAFFRGSYLDNAGVVLCIILMSISALFYIIGGQYLIAKILRWLPISGFNYGLDSLRFLLLPVLISMLAGVGAGSRWYRSFFLEEYSKEYVIAARSRGVSEVMLLYRHVLRNALIPILTGVVVLLPLLFMGSLITESFFSIPGLGSYTIDAIASQDFAIVRAMVFLGTVLYIIGLILTDLAYCLVDPRIKVRS